MAKSTHDPAAHDPEKKTGHEHDDDVIIAPKGSRKARFVMTFLLVITLLTTFSVSSQVIDVFTGKGGRGSSFITWKDLNGDSQSMSESEFMTVRQNLAKVYQIVMGRNERDKDDDEAAFFVVQANVAEDSGIHITAKELGKFILDRFGSGANYRELLSRFRISTKEFEDTLRKLLAIQRYQGLMMAGLTTPDMTEVEKLWKQRHQEYAFEFIELPVESFRADATALVPNDEDLKAWFDAFPDAKKDTYKRGTAAAAELAVYPLDGSVSTDKLFARYPRPEGEDLDAAAKEYYDGNSFQRFRNHNLPQDRQPTPQDFFLPFENPDVQAAAKREAPIYRSLGTWQSDMSRRADEGQTINMAEEAAQLGLLYRQESKPLTLEEWQKIDAPWMSRNVADWITGAADAGKFPVTVSVDEKALVVGRVTAKEEPRTPEFSELREKVREEWITNKMGELALARLESVRDKLGTRPDSSDPAAATFAPEADHDKFAQAAADLGLQVQVFDFMERAKNPGKTPAESYLRMASPLYVTKENTVPKAELARDGKNAYLVRIAGLRDADLAKMTPAEMNAFAQQSEQEAIRAFRGRTFTSREFMREQYDLHLKSWDKESEAKQAN